MAMKDAEKNMAMSEKLADKYRIGDACERAFRSWRAGLDLVTRSSLKGDEALYEAVSNAFYGADSQEELDALMGKTPEELAAIGKGAQGNG